VQTIEPLRKETNFEHDMLAMWGNLQLSLAQLVPTLTLASSSIYWIFKVKRENSELFNIRIGTRISETPWKSKRESEVRKSSAFKIRVPTYVVYFHVFSVCIGMFVVL